MIWLNVLVIVCRVLFALCIVGWILGLFLHKKYRIFEEIFVGVSHMALVYGLTQMLIFAILGEWLG